MSMTCISYRFVMLLAALSFPVIARGQHVERDSKFVLTETWELFCRDATMPDGGVRRVLSNICISALLSPTVLGKAITFENVPAYAWQSTTQSADDLLQDAMRPDRAARNLLREHEAFEVDNGAKEIFTTTPKQLTVLHFDRLRLGYELFYVPDLKLADNVKRKFSGIAHLATRETVSNRMAILWPYEVERHDDGTVKVAGPVTAISFDRNNRIGGNWRHLFDSSWHWLESSGEYAFEIGGEEEIKYLPVKVSGPLEGRSSYKLRILTSRKQVPMEIQAELPWLAD